MRTHFLSKLSIPGQQTVLEKLPDFDFYRVSRVLRLLAEIQPDGSSTDLFLTSLYSDPKLASSYKIALHFINVRSAKLPELSPLCFLSELEIDDLGGDQLSKVGYHVKNYGSTDFDVFSEDLSINVEN